MAKTDESQADTSASTEITAVKTSSIVISDDDEFGGYAGQGMENVGVNDLLVPRLSIIQALSPQLKQNKAEYIPDAKLGVICDVGVGELFPNGVLFLPVYYRKDWLEWAPRSTGKGLVAIHNDPSIMEQTKRDEKQRPIMPNGNLISETAQFFGINLSAGRRKCFLPMASTQLRKARKWNLLATSEHLRRSNGTEFVAPLWYRSYMLTTAEESNNEGDWAGWVINRAAAIKELDLGYDWHTLKEEAISFREAIIKGELKADTSGMHGTSDGDVVDGSVGDERAM